MRPIRARWDAWRSQFTHVGGPTAADRGRRLAPLTDPTFDPPAAVQLRLGDVVAKARGAGDRGRPTRRARRGPAQPRPARRQPRRRRSRAAAAGRDRDDDRAPGRERLGGARRADAVGDDALEAAAPPIEITATPCRHGPPLSKPIVGEVIGFGYSWEGQHPGEVWISGDTVLYPGVPRSPRASTSARRSSTSAASASRSRPAPLHDHADEAAELMPTTRAHHRHPDPLRGLDPLPRGPDRGRVGTATGLAGGSTITWLEPGTPRSIEV